MSFTRDGGKVNTFAGFGAVNVNFANGATYKVEADGDAYFKNIYENGTLLSTLYGGGSLPDTQTMTFGGTDGLGFYRVNGVTCNRMTVNKWMGFNIIADRTGTATIKLVTIGLAANASFTVVSKLSTLATSQIITTPETSATLYLSITDNMVQHHTLHSSVSITEGYVINIHLNNLEYTQDLGVMMVYLDYS